MGIFSKTQKELNDCNPIEIAEKAFKEYQIREEKEEQKERERKEQERIEKEQREKEEEEERKKQQEENKREMLIKKIERHKYRVVEHKLGFKVIILYPFVSTYCWNNNVIAVCRREDNQTYEYYPQELIF